MGKNNNISIFIYKLVNEIYNSLLITQKNVENLGKRKYVNSQQYLLDDTIFSSKILLVTLDDVQPL